MSATSVTSNLYRALRRGNGVKALWGQEPFHWVRSNRNIVEFGSKYGRWALHRSALAPSTVMMSFGLGDDITFEQALLERGVGALFGFDPTPKSVAFIQKQTPLAGFTAHAVALAAHDGELSFALPPQEAADQVSASSVAAYAPSTLTVPCLTLRSAKHRCGVQKVDILKMDIEGAEYAVLDQALSQGDLEGVTQLMVEFHHFLPGLHPHQTRDTIDRLEQVGFQIAWVGRTNHEYLFVRGL